MLIAPTTPSARLHAMSVAGSRTSRNAGRMSAVQSDEPISSTRRPTRSESAPNIGASRPRAPLSQRKARPTVATSMPARCTK
jgi:hypothetical protein